MIVSGCYSEEQACDFRTDCGDNTDERECPNVYLFDDCTAMTGKANCGWEEEPRDSLDWKLVNESMIEVDKIDPRKII